MNYTEQQILIIGASGLVGSELISILLEHGMQATNIIATASKHSIGKVLNIEGNSIVLHPIHDDLFYSKPLVFQCASNEAALKWTPIALDAGCTVIDCSSTFRLNPEVPLTIPSVNSSSLETSPTLVAGPNCTTIILLTAIHGIHMAFDIKGITVATYQSISGAGKDGLRALTDETNGKQRTSNGVFPEPCALNVFCHESLVNPNTGFNSEEENVIDEIHKIWDDPDIQIIPTCMRVPIVRVHTESITLTIRGLISEAEVLNALHNSTNVVVLNDEGNFPTALKASCSDVVLVGHVRVVAGVNETTVSIVACGDQIRTGAALNAVRIAEKLFEISTKK